MILVISSERDLELIKTCFENASDLTTTEKYTCITCVGMYATRAGSFVKIQMKYQTLYI